MIFRCSAIIAVVLLKASHVLSNVEKAIFLGPPAITIPSQHPNLDDLFLIPLSSLYPSARIWLNATFPTKHEPRGTQTWILLDGLKPGARYEVRICWLATVGPIWLGGMTVEDNQQSQQPTAFSLSTHTLTETFDNPDLIAMLSSYANARQELLSDLDIQQLIARRPTSSTGASVTKSSTLFLQIYAAAEYYTMNKTLMAHVPPVLVDVILDSYLLNIFPRSLVPTAGYIAFLAVIAWFVSGFFWHLAFQIAKGEPLAEATLHGKKTS